MLKITYTPSSSPEPYTLIGVVGTPSQGSVFQSKIEKHNVSVYPVNTGSVPLSLPLPLPTPYTLHPAPCTLHPTPYTPIPESRTAGTRHPADR